MDFIRSFFSKKNKEANKLLNVILSQGLMSTTTFLTGVILARVLPQEDFANYVLLAAIALFILGIQNSLITTPYAIMLKDFSIHERHSYFVSNVYIKLILSTVIIIPLLVLSVNFNDQLTWNEMISMIVYISAFSFYFFVQEILLSNRETKRNLIYGIYCSSGICLLLAWMYYFKIEDLSVFLIVSSMIYSIIFLGFIRKANLIKLNLNRVKNALRENWIVGKWLMGSNLFWNISYQIYPWLLLYFFGKKDVAILGVLISISNLINPALVAISSYLLPIFSQNRDNLEHLYKQVYKWLVLFFVISISLVLIGYLFGSEIIVLFYGTKYGDLGILVVLPFINQGLNILFQPIKIFLDSVKRTDLNFYILVMRSVIAVTIGYVLISKYGLIGVFITKIIETSFYILIQLIIFINLRLKMLKK